MKFRDWHRTLSSDYMVMDIDQIEYRRNANGLLVPVAIVELTSAYKTPIPETCKTGVIDRIFNRSAQGEFLAVLANQLRVPAMIFLFAENLSEIWYYDIVNGSEWMPTDFPGIAHWYSSLKPRC